MAINAVLDDLGELPDKIECISYRWIHRWLEKKEDVSNQLGINPGPDAPHISVAIHVFRIRVDYFEYEVTIKHQSILLKRL
ncbi:MAG: hypothetical protein OXE77_01350 [Flavobacteriaceae bacterium]|nr:hypothetical protein [Flavobacteriaceae bacterium]MCY4268404.1 hypothetical protein [Flavobacteriaceae bacterium]MCY4299941.1 hypothetical protein [Flavobacteriaceae bacterium]